MRLGAFMPTRGGLRTLLGTIRRQHKEIATPIDMTVSFETSSDDTDSDITLVSVVSMASVETKVASPHPHFVKIKPSLDTFHAADIKKDGDFFFRVDGRPENFLDLRVDHTLFRVSSLLLSN
jgi:hypothetical protein